MGKNQIDSKPWVTYKFSMISTNLISQGRKMIPHLVLVRSKLFGFLEYLFKYEQNGIGLHFFFDPCIFYRPEKIKPKNH